MGFTSQRLDNLTQLLLHKQERTALAVLLNESEIPEVGSGRFNNLSPVSYALTKADKERLPWVLVIQGDRIRLYNTKNVGVGRRGRTETYVGCQPSLISCQDLGLIWLLFSSEALKAGGTIESVLEESKRFAANIANRLRDRIYETVVPKLAMGIAQARNLKNPSREDLDLTYEMALTVLFRLLFIAYAEDRDLLPYKGNEAYRKRSLKQKAIELEKAISDGTPISEGDHHWSEISQLWKAVSRGNKGWGVPAYNGAMFSSDAEISKAGAELASITLPNEFFEEALRGLLLTESSESEYAPVDFRALSVREFGTIYEGLLESELSVAEQNLTTNKKGTYLPSKKSENVKVRMGAIYLHDRSGARKSSGSYYTPDFAVEHLLDGALEPALDEHLQRMTQLADADRAEQFFDFRVADIAMGSGHFLVAAVDRIERRFALWLEENPTPAIKRELQKLREAAKKELGDLADGVVIEDGQLLRRMIAKRCIYGVDLNPVTVQLARLSIWIHTFVPGLPLSLLDHNLVAGNSLIGVGSLNEIRKKFNQAADEMSLVKVDAESLLGQAEEPLRKLAKLSDSSMEDIKEGRALIEEAKQKTVQTEALCDLITAQPAAERSELKGYAFEKWEQLKHEVFDSTELKEAREILAPLTPLHFPTAFPEVFLGRYQGFNVILGNPPWEEIKAEERDFWTRQFPGLRALTQREQMRKWRELAESRPDLQEEWKAVELSTSNLARILKTGNFPGIGAGDLDLYKAFCWRFWHVISDHIGRVGAVFPRSAITARGLTLFRKELFEKKHSLNVAVLQNTRQWIFKIHPQSTILLVSISKNSEEAQYVTMKGVFSSIEEYWLGMNEKSLKFSPEEVLSWNDDAALPLLPSNYSAGIFKQLRKAPRLDLIENKSWRARPDTQLHATAQKPLMDLDSKECPKGFWPVYKGKSYTLWQPDRQRYYAWADPNIVLPWLYQKRLRASKSSRDSVHKEFSPEYVDKQSTLAPLSPKISFRLITNRTNRRTMVCALTPPNVFHSNSSQLVMFPQGDQKDEAFLLGVLSSIPLDWYARRFVELNFNFVFFNPLPIPRPDRDNPLWRRVVELSGRLACSDERFSEWAAEVGVEFGGLDPDDKNDKIYELDAVVAHLYGLSKKQLTHIFKTFHEGWDYKSRLKEVLAHYQAWSGRT
ncbi:MAG: hypothetical protein ISN29_11665 [Gammaproteobacteria bacterium AqS3]|nr:hypothetical protein [Gammaproteobacteria bacterium AqS3]